MLAREFVDLSFQSKLNLGCWFDIRRGFVNLDVVDSPGVDVVHDLNMTPWPFDNDTFDYMLCSHVLEHLVDFRKTAGELHRVSKAGCTIEILAPYFLSTKYFGDPSHRMPFSFRSFDCYTAPRKLTFYNRWRVELDANAGSSFPFETVDKHYIFDRHPLIRWLGFFHNLAPIFYERFCPALLPPMEVYFRLKVVK